MDEQSNIKFWSFLLHAIIVVWSLSSPVKATSSNKSDRSALLAFKDKITEDPLGALSSWNDSLHYCEWQGVTCSNRHRNRVTILDLRAQKLEGTLSPYIGNLSFLRGLRLTLNKFHDSIPQEIGRLSRLRNLFLNNNSFTGVIPSNLTHCSNLRQLTLTDNSLSGIIPTALSTLSQLTSLALAKNQLQGTIPSSLGNLSSLSALDLAENSLEGNIPDDLCRIHNPNLDYFNIDNNNLLGKVPACLYNFSQVTKFSIAQNQLLEGELPLDIGLTLPRIQRIYLGGNKLTGPIPYSLFNASGLRVMSLEINKFTGSIPTDIGRLQNLQRLLLHSNQLGNTSEDDLNFITSLTNNSNLVILHIANNLLRGALPNSIANLSSEVSLLALSFNQIHGSVPVGIGSLSKLNWLDLQQNYLSGSMPATVGMLPQLQRLYLNGNQFSGIIPDSFKNSSQLTNLQLAGNKFHGSIPQSLGNCQNLFYLNLSNNNLSGRIPEEVIGIASLKLSLDLSNNAFIGSLPSTVGNLSGLVHLDISKNRLSGYIPDALGKCVTLEYLNMGINFFAGQIPESLSTLKGIKYWDLSHNKLAGHIPEYLESFPLLTYLNLSFNELEGPVPKENIFTNASAVSVSGNSKLCGGVTGLKLPPCNIDTVKKGKVISLNAVIPVIVVSVCLVLLSCILFMCYLRRRPKAKINSPSLSHRQYTTISYAELLRATDSFSAENLIGAGSFGSVYKGVLSNTSVEVAVKVLKLEQPGASKSFFSECTALRNIRHRNLVKIITTCSTIDFQGHDFKALVFEYLPNGSLEEWLHPKLNETLEFRNLSFLQRLEIAIDVASALDYLHHDCEPAIVHCDLKPSNILLDDEKVAHVADFGLAKIFSQTSFNSSQGQTSSIALKGSIGYIAPEYGLGGEISTQGDVYSYGILLLEMFTGKRPTDDIFQDGKDLHAYSKMALPEQVINIMDQRMISKGSDKSTNIVDNSDEQVRMQKCFVSTIKLGVTCSSESPHERLRMGDVITELHNIRNHNQEVRISLK